MRQRSGSRISWPSPVRLLLFELAFLAAYVLEMAFAEDGIAPFRFSEAVLLCGLLLSPPKEWWLYALVTLPIRLFLFVHPNTALWLPFGGFASDSLKSLLSAWLLRRASRHHAWFDTLHEFSRYFLVAVVLASGLSAFVGGALHAALGHSFWTSYQICFLGGALASLVFAPFILLLANYKGFSIGTHRYVEAFLAAAGLVLTAYITFRGGPNSVGFPLFLLYLPFLLWGGIRFGPMGASGSLLSINVLSIFGTRLGRAPFYLQSHETSLLSTQLSLFFASVPFMFVSVITYQQRRKLREIEERFRSVVDVAPVMLWMSGTDARCTFFSKSWLDFTGLSLREETEQDWVMRVHAEDRRRCVNEYLSAFKSRENFTLEYRLLRNDGVYRWVLHNGVPRYADDGTFLGYVGSRVDFTDRREAEEHLRELSNQLLSEQETERFRIGHELQEDLAQKLCTFSIHLSRRFRVLHRKGDLAAGLDELQQQLRDVSNDVIRLSKQLRPATVERLDLSAALRNLCQQTTDHKRAVLFVQSEDVPPIPENVSLALYGVAQESLRNALSHSEATHINVELRATATTVRLSVRDNGCGFVVGFNTKAGLGLSGMSGRMRSAGGVLNIISNPGEGTTVIATMPLTESRKVGATA